MEFVYVQVNETHEYVQDSLNTTTMVVLEVLFPYGFIYEMGPLMSKRGLRSPNPVPLPLSSPKRGRGMTVTTRVPLAVNIIVQILYINVH